MNNIKNLEATRRVHILLQEGGNRIRIAHAVCLPKCLFFDCCFRKKNSLANMLFSLHCFVKLRALPGGKATSP